MNGDDPTNLGILKNMSNEGFFEELEMAPVTLHPHQSVQFFDILLSFFKNDESINKDNGNMILNTITKVLTNDRHLTVFIQEGFASGLPFRHKIFHDAIFDILFVLVSLGPQCFDDDNLTRSFAPMIKRDPKKALTLLAIYSEKFNEVENPWPMVDLLIQEAGRFTETYIAGNYATLLAYLCTHYQDYCQGRAEHCWKKICLLLTETDILTLKIIYCALTNIARVYNLGTLPLSHMKHHLRIKELQRAILSLLICVPLQGDDCCDFEFFQTITNLAQRDVRATTALMKAAQDEVYAEFMVNNSSYWMGKELPTTIDSIRLFLVIFKHHNLRENISRTQDFTEFLKLATDQENSGTLSMICTFLRRVKLDQELVKELSESGFLRVFFNMCDEIGNNISFHSALLMIDTLSRICYTREYMKMCDTINNIIRDDKNNELREVASLVAVQLCQYRKCALSFKRKRLDEFMKENIQDSQIGKAAARFLEAIADVY